MDEDTHSLWMGGRRYFLCGWDRRDDGIARLFERSVIVGVPQLSPGSEAARHLTQVVKEY